MNASSQQILVTVAKDGTVSARTKNIKGTDCLDYISVLEDLLEATTTRSAFTEEYGQAAAKSSSEVVNDLQQW